MGRTYKPKVKLYTETSINTAIDEVQAGATLPELQDLVQEFITFRGYKTRFKNNRPGYDWVNKFMK